jgi:hypothetical protein
LGITTGPVGSWTGANVRGRTLNLDTCPGSLPLAVEIVVRELLPVSFAKTLAAFAGERRPPVGHRGHRRLGPEDAERRSSSPQNASIFLEFDVMGLNEMQRNRVWGAKTSSRCPDVVVSNNRSVVSVPKVASGMRCEPSCRATSYGPFLASKSDHQTVEGKCDVTRVRKASRPNRHRRWSSVRNASSNRGFGRAVRPISGGTSVIVLQQAAESLLAGLPPREPTCVSCSLGRSSFSERESPVQKHASSSGVRGVPSFGRIDGHAARS